MGDKLNLIIKEYKDGNEEKISLIIERMMPLIKKYVRLLYKEERDDMYSEFYLTIVEALSKMTYVGAEGQCVSYLQKAIKIKFYELYRKSKKHYDNETVIENQILYLISYKSNEIQDVIFKQDINEILSKINDEKKRKILYSIIFENQSITKVAKRHQVSRQYANRIKKDFYIYLSKSYFQQN